MIATRRRPGSRTQSPRLYAGSDKRRDDAEFRPGDDHRLRIGLPELGCFRLGHMLPLSDVDFEELEGNRLRQPRADHRGLETSLAPVRQRREPRELLRLLPRNDQLPTGNGAEPRADHDGRLGVHALANLHTSRRHSFAPSKPHYRRLTNHNPKGQSGRMPTVRTCRSAEAGQRHQFLDTPDVFRLAVMAPSFGPSAILGFK